MGMTVAVVKEGQAISKSTGSTTGFPGKEQIRKNSKDYFLT